MVKKVKVREIPRKFKVIGEVHGEGEGDKEIKELTWGEVPVHDVEFTQPGRVIFRPDTGDNSPRISRGKDWNSRDGVASSRSEIAESAPLYETRGGRFNDKRAASYKAPESIGESGIKRLDVGRDFSMNSGKSDYPEANRIETKLRDESKNYASSNLEQGGRRERKRYAWET